MKLTKQLKVSLWIFGAMLCGGPLDADTLRVPSQYPDLQSAYQAAAVNGDVILIDDGVYTGQANTIVVNNKDLEIIGNGNQVIFDLGGVHQFIGAVSGNTGAIDISKINVINGSAAIPSIDISSGTSVFSQCEFSGHRNIVMRVHTIELNKCKFIRNTGVSCVEVTGSTPSGLSMPIEYCQFENNASVAIRTSSARLSVDYSEFYGNDVAIQVNNVDYLSVGTSRFYVNRIGIDCRDSGILYVVFSRFAWNGAAIKAKVGSFQLWTNVIVQNGTPGSPDAVISAETGVFRIDHCTIADNYSTTTVTVSGVGLSFSNISNSILWNQTATHQIQSSNVSITNHNNNLAYGAPIGNNYVSGNPQFSQADAFGLDYSLKLTSPARDSATIYGVLRTDIDEINLDNVTAPDIGAYEYCRHISKISILGMTELLFFGQPGEAVGVACSPQEKLSTSPITTPLGFFYLDPSSFTYVGGLGTINGKGVFSILFPSSAASPYKFWAQALIGPELSKNALRVELRP